MAGHIQTDYMHIDGTPIILSQGLNPNSGEWRAYKKNNLTKIAAIKPGTVDFCNRQMAEGKSRVIIPKGAKK